MRPLGLVQLLLAIVGPVLWLATPFFWVGVAMCALAFGIYLGRRGALGPAELGPRRPARVISLEAERRRRRNREGIL